MLMEKYPPKEKFPKIIQFYLRELNCMNLLAAGHKAQQMDSFMAGRCRVSAGPQ